MAPAVKGWLGCSALVMVLGGLLLGCTADNNANSGSSNGSHASNSSTPQACEDLGATTTSLSPKCQDALFTGSLAKSPSDEVKRISNEKKVAFGRGLCAYGAALGASTAPRPLYSELIASNAKSWGVSTAVVEELYAAAHFLCPTEMAIIEALPRTRGLTEVALDTAGAGTASVTYTVADGSTLQQTVKLPWHQIVQLPNPIAVTVVVRPVDPKNVECVVAVGGQQLDKQGVDAKTGLATCDVSGEQIERAAVAKH